MQLKWPNDLRIDGRKLGGILSELAVDDEARYTLVMGIGINLHLEPSARQAIDQPAIGLDEILPPQVVASEREAWIGRLAAAVLRTLDVFSREGFAAFRPRFNALMEGPGPGGRHSGQRTRHAQRATSGCRRLRPAAGRRGQRRAARRQRRRRLLS